MRVCHFYKHFLAPGGMPRETFLLARAMADLGVEVFVYCLTPRKEESGSEMKDGIYVRKFYLPSFLYHRKFNLFLPKELITTIYQNSDEIDIMILTGSYISEHYYLTRLLLRKDIPYIVSIGEAFNPNTFHPGLKSLRKKIWNYFFERKVINGACGVRIYSDVQRSHLMRLGYKDVNCFVVKEGIDWELIPDALRGISDSVVQEPPVFGFMGRFDVYKKGIDVLIKGFSLYKSKGLPGVLKIVGIGNKSQNAQICELIDNLNLRDSVHIIGPLYGFEKFMFLKNISILCVPSRHEGIPRVVREALAVGCPVMVTDNTNLHDIVSQYQAGLVVACDAQSIATEFEVFATLSAERRKEMSRNAFYVAQKLSWHSIAREYILNMSPLQKLTTEHTE
jgi:glycosyltransferase involved in cell wall biosynthesis